MRAAIVHGPSDVRIEEIAEPILRPGSVAIEIAFGGICGSDLGIYQHPLVADEDEHPLLGEKGPHVLGHEFSGRVTALGDGVFGIAVGDLVAVKPSLYDGTCAACLRGETNICENWGFLGIHGGGGGFSERIVVEASKVWVLPDRFTPEWGALVEFLSVAWHAVRVSEAGPGTTAFVVGAGPIGLGLLLALRARGVEHVIVSELGDGRRTLATSLGADVIDPRTTDPVEYARARTGGAGVDVAFDASGVGGVTFTSALGALRSGGTTVVVANFHEPVAIDLASVMITEKRIVGSLAYTDEDYRAVIDAVQSGELDPGPMISSVIALDDLVEGGLEHLVNGTGRAEEVKILVSPALAAGETRRSASGS